RGRPPRLLRLLHLLPGEKTSTAPPRFLHGGCRLDLGRSATLARQPVASLRGRRVDAGGLAGGVSSRGPAWLPYGARLGWGGRRPVARGVVRLVPFDARPHRCTG